MLTDQQALAARIADAAGLIRVHGHTTDDFWTDAHDQDWRPELPVSVAGAVLVTRGHITYDQAIAAWSREFDPAITALTRHLGFRGPIGAALPGLWAWEDRTPAVFVAVALQRCADDLRAAVTCVSCGAEWPNHYSTCEFIRPVRDELAVAA